MSAARPRSRFAAGAAAGAAIGACILAPVARADGAPAGAAAVAPADVPVEFPVDLPVDTTRPRPCPGPWWEETRAHGGWATLTLERGFRAGLYGDRGSLSFVRAGFGIEWTLPAGDRWDFRGSLTAEEDSRRFSDPDAIVAGTGRLFEEAHRVRFEPQARYVACTGWGLSAGPIVQSAGVPGARFADTLTWGGQASVRVPLGGSTAIDLGASLETQLEGSPSFWPVFDLESASSGGRLHVGYLRSGIGSSGVRIAYDVTPTFAVSLLGRLEYRSWRLAEDDRVPGGVFRQGRAAPGLGVAWNPSSCVSLSAEAWLPVWDSIRIDDRRGDRVTDFGVDPAPVLGLTLSVRF